eukprot:jgi/Botrbrau1/7361/Bobra.0316s0009.2
MFSCGQGFNPLQDVQRGSPCLQFESHKQSSFAQVLSDRVGTQFTSILGSFSDALEKAARLLQDPPPGFPPGPKGEAVGAFLANPLEFLTRSRHEYGALVGLLLGGERVVIISDPTAARQVLIDQAGTVFVKTGTAFFPGSKLAGEGLLVSDGQVWRRQRQLSNPAFRKAAVERYAQAMQQAAVSLTEEVWSSGGERDVYRDFNTLTLRVVMDALFGSDLPPSTSEEVTGAIQRAFEYFAGRAATGFVVPEWLPTPDNLQYSVAVSRLDRVVYRLITQRRALLASAASEPHQAEGCLLDALLQSRDETGAGMTDEALRDELMTLLVAGQETSAILLGWAAARLAHHPAVQSTVHEEVDAVLQGALPDASNVRGLHRLQAVLLETLRLHPPAYLVGRCASTAVSLGPYQIPAGSTVLVSPYLIHRDSEAWQEAESFDITRWELLCGGSGGNFMAVMSGMGPNGSYLPFGAGPRNCIGTGFAMTEALIVLAMLLQKYRLEETWKGTGLPAADPRITLRPSAVQLRVLPRAPVLQ